MTLSLYPIVFWLYVQNLSNNHPNLTPDLNLFFSKDYNKKVKSSAKRIIECPFRQMSTSICAYNFPIWSNAMRRVIAEGMTPFCGKTDANGQKWCLAQIFPILKILLLVMWFCRRIFHDFDITRLYDLSHNDIAKMYKIHALVGIYLSSW